MRNERLIRLPALILLAMPLMAGANSPLTTAAQAISNPAPSYPEPAIDRGIEGVVLLKLDIDEMGHPLSIQVKNEDADPLLVAAARQTIAQWAFAPATKDGQAVRGSVIVPIRFQLESERYHNGSVLGPTAPWIR